MPHPQREQLLGDAAEHERRGRLQQAADVYQALLAADRNDVEALHRLGALALQTGESDAAVALLERAAELKQDDPQLLFDAGRAYAGVGEFDNAAGAYAAALRLRPSFVEARNNLGVAHARLGRMDDAMAQWRAVLEGTPDNVTALSNLARALMDTADRPDLALPLASRWAALRPGETDVLLMLAAVNRRLGRLEDALEAYQQLVRRAPTAAHYEPLGIAQVQAGLVVEGIASFRRGLEMEPHHLSAGSNLLLALHYDPSVDPQRLFEEHLAWASRLYDAAGGAPTRVDEHANDRDPDRRLRVGYVSGDFKEHAVESFIRPFLRAHDRRQVEVVCYYTDRVVQDATQRFRAAADLWRDVAELSTEALDRLIRDDRIDILVDLSGHSGRNRLAVFARKPAPVQVTYIGYCDTTGLREIDYRLTDAICDPPGDARRHTEELVRLEGGFSCFAPPLESLALAAEPPVVANGTITFGSMHGLAKLNDGMLDLWSALLRAEPAAKLLVCRQELVGRIRQRLIERFAARGIGADRLDIRGSLPGGQWLPVYHEIDVLLDVLPWSGHTTVCESLWMGVPAVTLAGRTHAGRMVASLVTHAGFPQWVASSPDQYLQIARGLAADVAQLRELRRTLRDRFRASRAMDATAFTQELEQAYRRMWRTWCVGAGVADARTWR